jgi:hypothetical protein
VAVKTIEKDCVGGIGTGKPCMAAGTEEREAGGLIVHLCPDHAAELDVDHIGEELDRLGATEIDVETSPRAAGAVRLFDEEHEQHVAAGDILAALRGAGDRTDVWALINELPEVAESSKEPAAWPLRETHDSSPTT